MPPPVVRFDEKSLVILDHDREWVFVADPEGRIEMIHTPEVSFKRSRFNRWYEVQRAPWPGLRETTTERIAGELPAWIGVWRRAQQSGIAAAADVLGRWIDEFFAFHEADARAFSTLFPKIPILPPDTYRALYVRIQEGCPWNRCAFCTFYKDERYRVVPSPELETQLAHLRGYWRRAIRSRHGFFLGDANAVAVPAAVLSERLMLIRKAFPEPELVEFHSFVDYFAGPHRTAGEWRALGAEGLRRLSLGVESGDVRLMELVDKPANLHDIISLVQSVNEAGVAINLIFLVGLGGRLLREAHLSGSLRLIQSLPLARTDRIYLSPLVIDPAQPYASVSHRENWKELTEQELRNELDLWQREVRNVTRAQISPYHIRQFIY